MRTHCCAQLSSSSIDHCVVVCGWVHRRRDHGGIIFVDLRDHTGLLQVIFDPELPTVFQLAESLRSEFVIQVEGSIRARPEGTVNPDLDSGHVELVAKAITILNVSAPLPYQLDENVSETVRLSHRVVDLRTATMQRNMRLRSKTAQSFRRFLESEGFLEIETPLLTRSTPEGARDYLVPSRVHPGEFFALPQSPQLFKQMLMVSGFERYYQIARCFRDEDLRADRQPEFTQVDLEGAFWEQEDVYDLIERCLVNVFQSVLGVQLPTPFLRMNYHEALLRYGSDKPDLRVTLVLTELTQQMKEVNFKVFSAPANQANGRVVALRVPAGAEMSRKEIDQLVDFVGRYGAKGLAWIKCHRLSSLEEGDISGLQSPIVKNIQISALKQIVESTQAEDSDLLLFGAGDKAVVNASMGALRTHLGYARGFVVDRPWAPLWVVDFPMFEYQTEHRRWDSCHHPFTAPHPDDLEQLLQPEQDLSQVRAQAYDLVLNGWEIGGGSLRIHRLDIQKAVFSALGLDESRVQSRFGFFLDALRLGAPPHGGFAFGLDRLVALMVGADSLRDVIAFPKTQRAQCLMTQAPSKVDVDQLSALGLQSQILDSSEGQSS